MINIEMQLVSDADLKVKLEENKYLLEYIHGLQKNDDESEFNDKLLKTLQYDRAKYETELSQVQFNKKDFLDFLMMNRLKKF